jgi:hypothetical protein
LQRGFANGIALVIKEVTEEEGVRTKESVEEEEYSGKLI